MSDFRDRERGRTGARSLLFGPALLALSAVLFFLPACSAFTSDAPPAADSTMVEVLVELHLAAARQQIRGDVAPEVREEIFQRYGLDAARFGATMNYYAEHPDAYLEVYNTILDRLSAERAHSYGASPGDDDTPATLPGTLPQ